MCSISGFIIINPSADRAVIADKFALIVERGTERGSDSIGIVSLNAAGTVARHVALAPTSRQFTRSAVTTDCTVGIANNRAEPTTEYVPRKTGADAQPFGDGTVYVTHNGTIANDRELRSQFNIHTETSIDTAVCPGLINQMGIERALQLLEGSFALGIIDRRFPQKLWLARNYKPLFLQSDPGRGALFFASRPQQLAGEMGIMEQLAGPAIVELPPYHLAEINGRTGAVNLRELTPRQPDRRALVICSGGLDSTTAARWAQLQGYEVTLLHFLYGSRAEKREVQAIKDIAAHLGVSYRLENLAWLGELGGSPLTDPALEIATGERGAEYAHEWVPARNLVFTALAAALCDRFGYDTLILGLNLEEGGAYPDNTTEFYEALDHVCNIGTTSRPRILSPLGSLVKHQIVALAREIDAPIHLSWSCYYGDEEHCGNCGPCYMRRTAFRMNNMPDLITYRQRAGAWN